MFCQFLPKPGYYFLYAEMKFASIIEGEEAAEENIVLNKLCFSFASHILCVFGPNSAKSTRYPLLYHHSFISLLSLTSFEALHIE